MPADQQVPRYRDAERARNTARIWAGLAVLFAVLAVLQWLGGGEPWIPIAYTVVAGAYAGTARGARRHAREVAARTRSRDPGAAGWVAAPVTGAPVRAQGRREARVRRTRASRACGRYWVRTSDLFGVNEALYH